MITRLKWAFLALATAEILKLEYVINDGTDSDSYIGNIPQDARQVKPNQADQKFSVVKGNYTTKHFF